MKSRSQKALLNTVVLGVYQLVYFVSGLILPRFLLLSFGSDYNGVVSSITQFLNFISILQLGIAGATRFSLYKVLAVNDLNGISAIINATERYMRKIGIILIGYICILSVAYPKIAETSLSSVEVGLLVLIIGASTFSQYFFGLTYQILLIADQKQYIYYTLSTIATMLNTGVAIALMRCNQNFFVVKIVSTVIYTIIPLILFFYVRKKYKIDKNVMPNKEAIKGRKDVMWHSIASIVHDKTDLIVLTMFSDIKLVSVYTVHYLVVNGLQKVLSIFTNSLEAGFGNMFAKKEVGTAYKNLEFYEFFMCSFVSLVFSCTLVLISPFVKVYTSDINDINYYEPVFAFVIVVAQMIMCLRQPYLTIVQAAGHYKQTKNGAFVEAGLNVIVSIIAIQTLGIVGVAVGTLVANSVRTFQYIVYLSKNILSRPLRKPLCMMAWTALNVFIIFSLETKLVDFFNIDSWMNLIMVAFLCFCVSFVVTLISSAIFCNNQLKQLLKVSMNFISKLLKKV